MLKGSLVIDFNSHYLDSIQTRKGESAYIYCSVRKTNQFLFNQEREMSTLIEMAWNRLIANSTEPLSYA